MPSGPICAINFPPRTTCAAPGADTPSPGPLEGSPADGLPRPAHGSVRSGHSGHDRTRGRPRPHLPGDRRDRLHRRPAGPRAARRGAPGAGDEPPPGTAARPPRVRGMSRAPERLRDHPWAGQVEVVRADAGDAAEVARAVAGADVVYYLVHALGGGPSFEDTDRRTAGVMADAAREAGLGRLVYLGGLEPDGEELSPHLRSRSEVAQILLRSGVPTVVLRAAVVLGSGSASFEMLRYLTE